MKKIYGPKDKHNKISFEKVVLSKANMESKFIQFIPFQHN